MRLGGQRILSTAIAAAMFPAVITFGAGEPAAATLDNVRQSGTVRIAYREDAIPSSLKSAVGELIGLTVSLYRAVVAKMAANLSMAKIKITYMRVTTADRFDAIEKGQSERVYTVRLPALPPKPFWMGGAQFVSFSRRNSSDDKS